MAGQPKSPFSAARPRPWRLSTDWMLLLTFVAAGTATLVVYALFLPAVTNEINAWMGRSIPPSNEDENRRAQVVFLLMCYAAPMILGIAARLVQLGSRKLVKRLIVAEEDDARFRME